MPARRRRLRPSPTRWSPPGGRRCVRSRRARDCTSETSPAQRPALGCGSKPRPAAPPDSDGLFEGKQMAFWIDLSVRREKEIRYLLNVYDEDAVYLALAGIGRASIPVIIDQMKHNAPGPDPALARGYSPALVCIG